MLYNSWKLALVGVVVLCVAFLPVILIRKRVKAASNKNMVIGGNIVTNYSETYQGNKIVTAYNLQNQQIEKFKTKIWESFAVNMSLIKRTGWMNPLMYTIASIGIALVMGYGTHLILAGEMTTGSFTSFVTSLLLLYKPVKTMGNTLTGMQSIFVSIGRVFELFDIQPELQEASNSVEIKGLQQGISFENVYFEYVKNTPVLKNINLNININETLAIVGNSGGGKTTFVNLIPRFYDVTKGSIKIDGIDVKNIKITSLRNNIAVVFQDNFLFSGTIRENIMMGNQSASEEQLQEVLQAAHLDDMIQTLPKGLDSLIGERGTTLSGGQRQRVAIARAMIKNTPIIILDEATSALDNKSEKIVQKALDNLMKNKTVFVIAHRLSTIQNANRIAVINEGELVEIGSHEELMQIENGIYQNLYLTQFKKEEVLA
jgi:subfamily B ATP-binding cassette protein MsbA